MPFRPQPSPQLKIIKHKGQHLIGQSFIVLEEKKMFVTSNTNTYDMCIKYTVFAFVLNPAHLTIPMRVVSPCPPMATRGPPLSPWHPSFPVGKR